MAKLTASEAQIQKTIIEWLQWNKIFHYRQNSGGFLKEYTRKNGSPGKSMVRFGRPGSTDILCVKHGIYIGIEVKSKTGKQDPDQVIFQKDLERAGGIYLLVRSSEEVEKFFKNFHQTTNL